MSLITIMLFFIYTFGLGFALTSFVKKPDDFFERNLMRIGIGLGTIPILGVLLNFLHIPLHWIIFVLLSLAFPAYSLFKKREALKTAKITIPKNIFKIKKSKLYSIIVLMLFFILFYVMVKGSFVYPWLEDGDSWQHAVSAKYLSIRKTFSGQTPDFYISHYMTPYPPGYQIIMGVLHQTSPSIYWTLKFFNALIVSIIIIFFYYFMVRFTGEKNKSLFSTFALFAIPCYLSHFIWAVSLAHALIFPAFYCLEMASNDKRWNYVAAVIIASIMVSQPSSAFIFGIFFGIYWIAKCILEKKFLKNIFLAGVLGILISMLYWGPVLYSLGYEETLLGLGLRTKNLGSPLNLMKAHGSASRVYNFNDFFITKTTNMINNPVGIGAFLCIIVFVALVSILFKNKKLLKKENHWLIISFLWLVFTFIGVHGERLPYQFFTFRFWAFLAIPVCILAGEGLELLIKIFRKIKISSGIVVIVIVIGVLLTSGYQKYTVNTAIWPFQDFSSYDEMYSYIWLKDLPVDTLVMPMCFRDFSVIGMDKLSYRWEPEVREFKEIFINKTPEQIHSFMKKWKYEYFIIDAHCIKNFGENETNVKLQEIGTSPLYFQLAYPTQENQPRGAFIFKVN
ncbi:MAG: hypothetical protein PHV16_01395 [Candidatus Nanoarchaeia archaeon]|nr:hypothetical protein [Candidatus Nanoarchaeia archaeon]